MHAACTVVMCHTSTAQGSHGQCHDPARCNASHSPYTHPAGCSAQIQVNAAGWALSPALFALRYLDSELLSLLLLADMDVRRAWLEDPSGRRLAHCPLVAALERRDLALPERTALLKALINLGADPRDR